MCFGASLISGFRKCHFYFYAKSRNAQICNLKWRLKWIRFLGYIYVSQKNWDGKLKFGMLGDLIYICIQLVFRFFKIPKNTKSCPWVEQKSLCFGKIRDSNFEELIILRLLLLFICIWFTPLFWQFFNIYKFSVKISWHWVT